VKYEDDLVLLAREESLLQDMIVKLIEIGECYEIEMNVEKNKSNKNFKKNNTIKKNNKTNTTK